MTISVIIPTYNGAHKILNVLRSIEKQTCPPDQVIVVIDGSTDDTKNVITSQVFSFRSLRIIERENGGRAKVRNTGAAHADGALLIFFDDDLIPDPDCICAHIRHHARHQGSILTGAQIDRVTDKSSDFQHYKAHLSGKWAIPLIALQDNPLPEQAAFITAANFSIPKNLFSSLNGFDERLTDAEDHDLAVRAAESGAPLFYDHNAFAWHDDPVSCRSYIRRMRQYRLADEKLYALGKKKHLTSPPGGVKGLFFSIFCHEGWIRSIDRGIWRYMLPRKLRYRLYDFVVTANGSFFPQKVVI